MLGLAGIPLGVTCRFLDPSPEAPAAVVGDLLVGALDDIAAARRAARDATVVTYEWEGVPAETARAVEAGVAVLPAPAALEVAQDRLVEKDALRALGIATAPYRAVDDRAGLDAAVAELGLPAVLKTRRGGYDGKGQAVLRTVGDVDPAWSRLGARAAHPRGIRRVRPRDLDHRGARRRRRGRVLARGRERARRRDPPSEPGPRARPRRRAAGPSAGLHPPAARFTRLRGRRLRRAVRRERHAPRERDRATRPQQRALDDRGRRDQPVREPSAGGARLAVGFDRGRGA